MPSADPPLRVVVADDFVVLREGVASLLEAAGIEVVAQAGNVAELMRKVISYTPDVAIVDVRMPPTNTNEGIEAATEIRRRRPQTGVLVVSQAVEKSGLAQLFDENAGAVGYLLKERIVSSGELVTAVRRVAQGEQVVDPEVVAQLMGRRAEGDPLHVLTDREYEVLALIAEGLSNKTISLRLMISRGAVEQHASNIFRKLELDDAANQRVQAVLTFLRRDPVA